MYYLLNLFHCNSYLKLKFSPSTPGEQYKITDKQTVTHFHDMFKYILCKGFIDKLRKAKTFTEPQDIA